MSKQVALGASARAGSGKTESRSLRRQGRVPAIAYGTQLEPTPISVDALELFHALHTAAGENAILRLDIDGRTHLALTREIQRHPVRRDVLHVDFVTVSRDVKVSVEVPVVLEGESPGVAEGGVAEHSLHAVQVEVLPLEVPDQLVLDVSDMLIGDVKRAADLLLPAGVELTGDPEATIVSIVPPTVELEAAEGAAVAEEEAQGATAQEARETVAGAEATPR